MNDAVPVSTTYKNKCELFCRMAEVKVPVVDCGSLFKDCDLHKVTALRADIVGIDG